DDIHGNGSMLRRRKWRGDRHRSDERGQIGTRVDRLDSIHRLGRAGVDRRDAAMCDITSLECQMLHAGDFDVVDVGGAPLDETGVLTSFYPLAYELWQHRRHGHGLPLGGVLDGVDDVLVAGAAAEIPHNALANLALTWRRVVVQKVDGGHDHAWRAVA